MIDYLVYVDIAGFVVLATLACWFAQDWGGWTSGWWASAVGILTIAIALTPALAHTDAKTQDWLARSILAILLLFPYLGFRLALSASSINLPRPAEVFLAAVAVLVIASALVVPDASSPDGSLDSGSTHVWFVTTYWITMSLTAAAILWRRAPSSLHAQPARRRLAAALLGLATAVCLLASPELPLVLVQAPIVGLLFACWTYAEVRQITKAESAATQS